MIKPENIPIRDRILALAKKFGIEDIKRGGRLARHLGVPNSVIYRLLDNFSLPAADNLKKICENANVSADYILFGRELYPQISEQRENVYDVRLPAQLDSALLTKVLASVDATMAESRPKISDLQKSRLISLIYEHCSKEKEKPNIVLVKRYLLLTD